MAGQTLMGTNALENKIENLSAQICVIGLGYVGLPVAVRFAEVGFQVVGVDINKPLIARLRSGKSHIHEVSDEKLKQLGPCLTFLEVEQVFAKTSKEVKSHISRTDVYVICVPTPLKNHGKILPDERYVYDAFKIVDESRMVGEPHAQLIVVESTTYPGCTAEIYTSALSLFSSDIGVAYSPERIDPGRDMALPDIPKVIGADTDEAGRLAGRLYERFMGANAAAEGRRKLILVSSTAAAETAKCAENGFRLVAISFANELARFAPEWGIDVWKLISKIKARRPELTLANIMNGMIESAGPKLDPAMILAQMPSAAEVRGLSRQGVISGLARKCFLDINGTNQADSIDALADRVVLHFSALSGLFLFELAQFCGSDPSRPDYSEVHGAILSKPYGLGFCTPGPGAGGHCIPIDPVYLSHQARKSGLHLNLIDEAARINEHMPFRVAGMVGDALNRQHKAITGSKILVLGVTYKANIPDLRESKAVEVVRLLITAGAEVVYCDPEFDIRQRELYHRKGDHKLRSLAIEFPSGNGEGDRVNLQKYFVRGVDIATLLDRGAFRQLDLDCVVLLTDHRSFAAPEFLETLESCRQISIVDTRNCISPGSDWDHLTVLGRPVR